MTSRIPRFVAHWIGAGLQRRLVVTLAAVLLALSGVFLLAVSGLYKTRLTAEAERAALHMTSLLHASLENAMLKRDLPGLRAILADLGQDPDILAVRVLNPEFEVRFASNPALEGVVLQSAALSKALASRLPQTALGEVENTVRVVHPVSNQPRCHDCHGAVTEHPVNGLLVLDYAATGLAEETRRSMGLLMLAGLCVTAASLLASWLVLRRTVITPLGTLTEGAEAVAAGRLDHRIPTAGQDEISALARTFNQMAASLQTAWRDVERSRTTLQAVLDAIPDAIRVIGPDYKIHLANAAYAKHVGLPLEGVLAQPCYRSSHRRDAPCVETMVCCPLVEAGLGHLPLTCHQNHLRGPDRHVHVELVAAPIVLTIDGQPQHCVVEAIRDLDQQARLSQEERLAELGLLSAGLAHEIYNPISSISLLLEAVEDDLAHDQTTSASERLGLIRQEIGRTMAVTNSLLSLCLPPSEDLVLVDLNRVLPEALTLLSYLARRSNCTLSCIIAPGLRLLAAESDLRMTLTNLVLNALHAMPKGGTIRVLGSRIGEHIRIEVIDEGIGIAPEHLSRIFLPFWTRRADGSPGRGLGLSIVHTAVTRMQGRIEVQSTLGKGSRFILTLPDPDAPLTANTRN